MLSRLRRGFRIDFLGRSRLWFTVSAVLILVSVGSLFLRGINAGLEFQGGTAFQVEAAESGVSVEDVRGSLQGIGIEQSTIQEVGERGFLVQTLFLGDDQGIAVEALAAVLGVGANDVNVTEVGPKWGAQITNTAVRALVIFFFVALVYLSLRLEPKMAVAGMVALFHDLTITAGIYSLVGFEVTPATVIALLTILGYSLYDTVVIFDRVKERTVNLSASGKTTYSQATNAALNLVVVRSIVTSVTSLLPVGSLLFIGSFLLGAQTLRELALALFIGILAGTYSSLFVAPPVLAVWKEREERWATLRARIAARGGESASLTAAIPVHHGEADARPAYPPAPEPSRTAPAPRTANVPEEPTPVPPANREVAPAPPSAGSQGVRKEGLPSSKKAQSQHRRKRRKRRR
jgi:preprotein translocase subunit SecF